MQTVVDSAMTREESLAGLDPSCPPEVVGRQELLTVEYPGFEGERRRGQLLVDARLVEDVLELFGGLLECGFPIGSVVPLADSRFGWDDDRSMSANNSSCFNWRRIAGSDRLSHHAFGQALDLNPRLNPWITAGGVVPAGAVRDPAARGTLTEDSWPVRLLLSKGWEWGGHWTASEDWHHFQKPLSRP